MRVYTYHTDPGHGWLEVPYRDVLNAGLSMNDFKDFSYARVDNYVAKLYLEEDCHMPLFLNALEAKGIKFKLKEKYHKTDAPMRDWPRIR